VGNVARHALSKLPLVGRYLSQSPPSRQSPPANPICAEKGRVFSPTPSAPPCPVKERVIWEGIRPARSIVHPRANPSVHVMSSGVPVSPNLLSTRQPREPQRYHEAPPPHYPQVGTSVNYQPQIYTREVAPPVVHHAQVIAPTVKCQPKAESEANYTPYKVPRAASTLNDENLKLLDHVHGCKTWEEHSNKEAVKMHSWLDNSVLAEAKVPRQPSPNRKGREYAECPTQGSRTIPRPARRYKSMPSESSFSSSAVTSRQEDDERDIPRSVT